MARTVDGSTVYFGYDLYDFFGYEDTIEEYDASGTRTASWVHGPGIDEPLAMNTTDWFNYHRDALGSVTRITNDSAGMEAVYRYDAFGGFRVQEGMANSYGFTSRETEASALYHYRARFYDAVLGRFLQADPSGFADGPNRYAYVGNNPVNFVDPSGLGGRIAINGGGGGGFGPSLATCYRFPTTSWVYQFCICMSYCLADNSLMRGCVSLWASEHNQIPDCATYCGFYATQETGGTGGGIRATCVLAGGGDVSRSPPSPSLGEPSRIRPDTAYASGL